MECRETLELAVGRFGIRGLAQQLGRSERQIGRWRSGETPLPPMLDAKLREVLGPRTGATAPADFTFIDLFAGIGGIRLGFERAGGRCVYTSEWNEFSQQTYQNHFRDDHQIAGDITQIEAESVPDHDVLLAGFPCQPFSIAGVSKKNALGRPHGFECTTQGTLFFDIQRIIATKKPKAFLLENVKNLMSHDGGNTFRVIEHVLNELGYQVKKQVIDGKRFVPQHR